MTVSSVLGEQERAGAEQIKSARLRNNLSQKELADKLNVSQTTISNWELGRVVPDAEQQRQLSSVLGGTEPGEGSLFADWLKRVRQRHNLTVPELAEKSGVSPPTIYSIESGRISNPHRSTRKKLESALREQLPGDTEAEIEKTATIEGLGTLQDFNPHDKDELPDVGGIYVFYDISKRPVYVGQSKDIAGRITSGHDHAFWFKRPVVESGSYIEIKDGKLRRQIEKLLIKFLKSNAVLNQKDVDRE